MKSIAEIVRTTLTDGDAVAALVSDRVYWGQGKQNEKEAIVVFSIDELLQGASADRRAYSTTIRCYAPDMDVASDIYEAVNTAMRGVGHYFTGGTGGISDDEDREGVMEISFNLK